MGINLLRSERGNSTVFLAVCMVGLAAVGINQFLASTTTIRVSNVSMESKNNFTLLRQNILSYLKSPGMLDSVRTASINKSAFYCLSSTGCPNGQTFPLAIYMNGSEMQGGSYYVINPNDSKLGFNSQGKVCNKYGYKDCKYRVNLMWKAECGGLSQCVNPPVRYYATIEMKESENSVLVMDAYNITPKDLL